MALTNHAINEKLERIFESLNTLTELITPIPGHVHQIAQQSETNRAHLQQQIDTGARQVEVIGHQVGQIQEQSRQSMETATQALQVANTFGGNANLFRELYQRSREQLTAALTELDTMRGQIAELRGNGAVRPLNGYEG